MQRARRMALVAALALAAGLALTGCRSQPSVAAYVGDHRYTQADVDRIFNEVKDKPEPAVPATRQRIVRLLVLRDLAKQVATARKVQVKPIGADFGQVLNLPTDSAYVKLYQNFYELQSALGEVAQPAKATDDDLFGFYRAGVAAGVFPAGASDEVVRQQLGNNEGVMAVFGLRDLLAAEGDREHVRVNPRFGPLAMPQLQQDQQTGRVFELTVPFRADAKSPVRDSS
jgi:hypothetical protein